MTAPKVSAHLDALLKPIEFDWAGKEHWHEEVFAREVKTLEEAILYIKALKDRLAEVTFCLSDLAAKYNEIINWIRQIEIPK